MKIALRPAPARTEGKREAVRTPTMIARPPMRGTVSR
jgi:hypothetical protein